MKRLVLKVGSAVLTEQNRIAKERLQNLVDFIALLMSEYEIILVSSGAVAAGYTNLKLDKKIVANKQALASIGQPFLLTQYAKKFEKHNIFVSQLLLTADDFDSRKRTEHAKNAIEVLLINKVLPIINENDVTATEELVFGDNDQLSAYVSYYFNADMLVILTDIDGYYDKNPKEFEDALLLKSVNNIDEADLKQQASPNSSFATGGIVTKLKAAKFLLDRDVPTFLSSGFDLEFAKDFLIDKKQTKGTLFKR
jgi:glutamate 5-kinase